MSKVVLFHTKLISGSPQTTVKLLQYEDLIVAVLTLNFYFDLCDAEICAQKIGLEITTSVMNEQTNSID